MIAVRPGELSDLPAVARIQSASPEAAAWEPASYLNYFFWVAIHLDEVAGFLAARVVTSGESELLNLAVEPTARRRGAASALLRHAMQVLPGQWLLEVRESNAAARRLYEAHGFAAVGLRPQYYRNPVEAGIVMRCSPC
ncbi:MAG: GNAT family N-acetyltransferase [Bryobacterales bacterium]|nr:GNAT family N-acetyltransferase [Bryobacterales bacterium]